MTEPRACAAAMTPNASTAAAKKTISASIDAERSPNMLIRIS